MSKEELPSETITGALSYSRSCQVQCLTHYSFHSSGYATHSKFVSTLPWKT